MCDDCFSTECKVHQDMDVDLDRGFLQDLRELKLLLEKDNVDEHKRFVCSVMVGHKLSD